MIEFESKRKVKNRLYSKFTLFVLILLLIFMLHSTYKVFRKHQLAKADLEAAIVVLDNYEKRANDLKNDLEVIESKVGIEEVLRENYSLSKDGEQAIFIVGPKESVAEPVVDEGFVSKIKDYLGGLFN